MPGLCCTDVPLPATVSRRSFGIYIYIYTYLDSIHTHIYGSIYRGREKGVPFVLSWSLGWQHIVIYTHCAFRINSTAVPGLCCKQFPIASKVFEPFLLYCWCPVAARIYCYLQHLRHPVNFLTVPGLCCTDFSLSAMIPSLYFCLYTYIHAFFMHIYIHISMHAQISYIYIPL